MLEAISASASIKNIQAGFRESGISPLDPRIPLAFRSAMDQKLRNQVPDLYKNIKKMN